MNAIQEFQKQPWWAPGIRREQKMGLGSQISITGSCSLPAQTLLLSCFQQTWVSKISRTFLVTLINNTKLCPNVKMIGINGCQGPKDRYIFAAGVAYQEHHLVLHLYCDHLWLFRSQCVVEKILNLIFYCQKTIQNDILFLQLLPLESIKKFLYDTLAFSSHNTIWQI